MESELTPTSLGMLLRDARARRSVSLAQAERDTRIRQHHLVALESDDNGAFPTLVHTRGLVRIYARYLGVDESEALALLEKLVGRPESASVRPSVEPLQRSSRVSPRLVLSLVTIAIVVGGLAYATSQIAAFIASATTAESAQSVEVMTSPTPRPALPSPTAVAPAVAAAPAVVAAPAVTTAVPTMAPIPATATAVVVAVVPTATRIAPSPTPTVVQGVKIEAKITGRVWLQVESDGRVIYSGILNNGDSMTWNATNRLFMHSGNAANVQVTFNGKNLGPLGAPGEVVKVEWTAPRA